MSKIYSWRKVFLTLRYSIVFLFLCCSVESIIAQSLACNGGVNISLDNNCEVIMGANDILKGPDALADPMDFILTIKNPDGTYPTDLMIDSDPNGPFDSIGHTAEFIKFSGPGTYLVSAQRKSDGTNCWGDLRIEDKLPPFTDSCPCAENSNPLDEDCMFSCSSLNLVLNSDSLTNLVGINPIFRDNCGDLGSVTFTDVLTEDTTCGGWIIIRTWQTLVSDFHGDDIRKDLNCVQKFVFKSPGADAVIPPKKTVIVSCGVDTDPESLREYFSNPAIFNNPNLDSALTCAYPTLPDTLNGIGITLRPIGLGISVPGTTDALCKITATYTDSPKIPDCEDIGYKFVRTWHLIDWCLNRSLPPLTQIIKVMDTVPPVFTIQDTIPGLSTNPWTCDSDVIVPAPDTIYDNCASLSQISWIAFVEVNGVMKEANASNGYRINDLPPGTYNVYYEVTDVCGNVSRDHAILLIKDLIKPIALAKRTLRITFSSFNGDCVAKVFASNIDGGSYDACDPDVDIAIRRYNDPNSTFADFVKFNSSDIDDSTPGGTAFGLVDIELKVTDDCGNYSLAWTTVRVEDHNTDVIKNCGTRTIQLDCRDNLDSAIVQNVPTVIFDGCERRFLPVDHEIRNNGIDPQCNTGTAVVDYFLEGSRDTICTKYFVFNDLNDLQITWPPAEIVVSCDDTDFGDVIITGGTCNKPLVSENLRDFEPHPALGYCKKIIRELTVIDWCNYVPNTGDTSGVYRFVQTIKIKDNEKPDITCEDVTATANNSCGMTGIFVNAVGFDGGICQDELEWSAAVDGDGDGLYEIILDPIASSDSSVTARIEAFLSVGTHNVRWRANDHCGNGSEVFCTITILDDIPPSPSCIGVISTATMNTDGTVTIWAADFDSQRSSTDNCDSDLTYSFSGTDPNVPSMMFTCDDLTDNVSEIIDLMVFVWDDSGNNEFCNVRLRIDDNSDACQDSASTASIVVSGLVRTPLGDRMESAEVLLSQMNIGSSPDKFMTGLEGQYSFQDNISRQDYQLDVTKEDDYLNGVSTLDLILIQRHILGMSNFNDAYKVIAADVNGDEKVSALDLVLLRSLILGRISELPEGVSWKFVDEAAEFADQNRPWPYSESIYLSDVNHSMTEQNFIGMKLGDVNGNAIANSGLQADSRSNNTVRIDVQDRIVQKGEVITMSLDFTKIQQLYGVQLTLALDNGTWLSVGNEMGMRQDHYALSEHSVAISWTTSVAHRGTEPMVFTFRANETGQLSDVISLDQSGPKSKVYYGEDVTDADLQLHWSSVVQDQFFLAQNIPNPFSDETTIQFSVPESGVVEFSIFDMTGRQIFAQAKTYSKGMNHIVIEKSMLDQSGIMYYQLSQGQLIATRKMVIID